MNILIPNNSIVRTNFKGVELEITQEIFKQKVKSMLLGGAIGDAMGVPVEMKTQEYIRENHTRVIDFLKSSLNIFFSKKGLNSDEIGMISDDTILTYVGVESILASNGIDMQDYLKRSLNGYKNFPYGFGKGTTKALSEFERLEQEFPGDSNYLKINSTESAGNGMTMKQSPFAAYFLANDFSQDLIDKNLETITKITHGNHLTMVASKVHNMLLMELIKSDNDLDLNELFNYLLDYSIKIESEIINYGEEKVSNLLKSLLSDVENGGLKSFEEILEKYGWGDKKITSSGYILTTLGIVYSIFLNKQNFDGLLDTVNIGGDTDTFAAIIGNLIGAYRGKFYDDYYLNGLQRSQELISTTNNYTDFLINNLKK